VEWVATLLWNQWQDSSGIRTVARGDSTETSDIDLLVRFEGRATFDRYMDLKLFLEDLLGCRVDLVTEHALRKEVRAKVEREMLRVA
jgi:hypothetical protein